MLGYFKRYCLRLTHIVELTHVYDVICLILLINLLHAIKPMLVKNILTDLIYKC